jgi:hypothetical protein
MAFTPSAKAVAIATQAGNNLVAYDNTLTALQAAIAAGKLAAAAYVDAYLSQLATNTYIEIGSAGAPPFMNGWVNYDSGDNTAGYFKDVCGVVHLKGVVKSGALGSAIFTLPAGYRPPLVAAFIVLSYNGSANIVGEVDIRTDGSVIFSGGSNLWLGFDNIHFYATQ